MALNTAQLQFTNAAGCKRWLEALPLTNAQLAQSALTQQIALVCKAGIAPADLLDTLDTLREPVVYVQTEIARKYTAKPASRAMKGRSWPQ